MPQSALPARIAAARSGPVRHGGSSRRTSLCPAPARASSTSSSICAPAPGCLTAIRACAERTSAMLCRCFGLPGGSRSPCSRRTSPTSTASCRPAIVRTAAILASPAEPVEMDGRGDHLAALQALDTPHGAFGERGKTGSGFAQRPFQQIVLAAADNGRGVRSGHAGGARQSRKYPEVQFVTRKQPLARHLAAGNRPFRHQFVELALSKPDVIGGFAGGEEIHPACVCIFLLMFNYLTIA